MRLKSASGQSLVEYVFVLALISLVAISILVGMGQRTVKPLASANSAMDDSAVASSTSAAGTGNGNGNSSANGNGKGNGNGGPIKSGIAAHGN